MHHTNKKTIKSQNRNNNTTAILPKDSMCDVIFFLDIYFTEFGTALTTILPILFQYCYKYCYSSFFSLVACVFLFFLVSLSTRVSKYVVMIPNGASLFVFPVFINNTIFNSYVSFIKPNGALIKM
jgi:hypothetical protein